MRKSIKWVLLAVAGVLVAGYFFFGKKQQKAVGTDIEDFPSSMVSASDSILSKEEMIIDTVVETTPLSIEEKAIKDNVEDEALDEKFAGASAKGATQAMNITENKNIEGPQKQKVEPKSDIIRIVEDVPDIIRIVEDDADIEEDIMISTEYGGEWVDLDDVDYIEVEPDPEGEDVFMVVEDAPEFPDGIQALLDYLKENIRYPKICFDNNIQGRVIVSFIVEKDGSISDPKVVKGVNPSLDKEAVRVISTMPKWKPGKQKGIPVRVRFSVPVNFRIN